MSRSHKIPAQDWLQHKELIRRLWVDENRSRLFITAELAKLGFPVTKRQFEHQVVKKWELPKYSKSGPSNPPRRQTPPSTHESSAPKLCGDATCATFESLSAQTQQHSVRQLPSEPEHLCAAGLLDDASPQSSRKLDKANRVLVIDTSSFKSPIPLWRPVTVGLEQVLPFRMPSRTIETCFCMTPLSLCQQWQLNRTYHAAHKAQEHCNFAKAEDLYKLSAQDPGCCNYRKFSLYRNIAVCLMNQGSLDMASRVGQSLLDITKDILQPTHYQRLCLLRTIASIHEMKGDLDIAETEFQEVFQIAACTLGQTHPLTLATMGNIASVLRLKEHHVESAALFRKVLDLRQQVHSNAFHVCQEMRQLADVLSDTGLLNDSISLYSAAETKAVESLGASHRITLRIQSNLGADLRLMGRFQESETLLLTARAGQEALSDAGYSDSSWTEYQYAKCLVGMKQHAAALQRFRQVRDFRAVELGEFDIRTLHCYFWLGWCYERLGSSEPARQHYQHARSRLDSFEAPTYVENYRMRWLDMAIARTTQTVSIAQSSTTEISGSVRVKHALEIENRDGSPVQCVIEVESISRETCAVAT